MANAQADARGRLARNLGGMSHLATSRRSATAATLKQVKSNGEAGGHMQLAGESPAQIEIAEKRSARDACPEEIKTDPTQGTKCSNSSFS